VDTTILAKQLGAIDVTGSSSFQTVKKPQRPMKKEAITSKDKAIFICIECDKDMIKCTLALKFIRTQVFRVVKDLAPIA
jgi:hypothetical protein